MVVASFLTKDLGIDWRWGESYFAEHLNDFELSSNNGGWQWASSSGCDAQPYFRIFNPITQSEKFDPEGKFIKRYLPQLEKLSKKSIHAPWKAGHIELEAAGIAIGRDYPLPVVDHDEDIAVIWSVLWWGRMLANKKIYEKCQAENKPVIIIEVGNLSRGETWRLCFNNINGLGEFGNTDDIDANRHEKLGIFLEPEQKKRRGEILIACQHEQSLQWEGQPTMRQWAEGMVAKVRQLTDRRIIVRPHPRSLFPLKIPGIIFETPNRVPNTYDGFDIFYNYHCVINHNSGPAVQAAIAGIPVICDSSSLASPVSGNFENLEKISLPDRTEWFAKLCHTEWTVDEISQGIPLSRLLKNKL
jgi:hypothetical protein